MEASLYSVIQWTRIRPYSSDTRGHCGDSVGSIIRSQGGVAIGNVIMRPGGVSISSDIMGHGCLSNVVSMGKCKRLLRQCRRAELEASL
jgi:hypothetical protein